MFSLFILSRATKAQPFILSSLKMAVCSLISAAPPLNTSRGRSPRVPIDYSLLFHPRSSDRSVFPLLWSSSKLYLLFKASADLFPLSLFLGLYYSAPPWALHEFSLAIFGLKILDLVFSGFKIWFLSLWYTVYAPLVPWSTFCLNHQGENSTPAKESFKNTKSKQNLKTRNLSSGLTHQQHLDHLQTWQSSPNSTSRSLCYKVWKHNDFYLTIKMHASKVIWCELCSFK